MVRRARGRLAVLGCSALAAAIGMPACREPTQVVVEAHTNVAYRTGLVVSFTVGGPSDTESVAPTTETAGAWGPDGFVGSLAVVPGSSDDAPLSVKVVLGVRRNARDCVPPRYDGCIVARRRLRYTPHARLRLPVTLYAACEGVPCDANTTCNNLGTCVRAEVDPGSCAGADGCLVAGDLPPNRDGGLDASAVVEGGVDGGADASVDGARDASGDAIVSGDGGGTPGVVDCVSSSCNLSTQICCFNRSLLMGGCQAPGTCSPPGFPFACDGAEDCPNGVCCTNSGGSGCQIGPSCMSAQQVCHSDGKCSSGFCRDSTQYYRTCQP